MVAAPGGERVPLAQIAEFKRFGDRITRDTSFVEAVATDPDVLADRAGEEEGVARAALSLAELEQYQRALPFLADM